MGIPLEVVPALNDTAPMSSPNPSSLTAVDGKKLGTALKTKVASESLEQRVTRVVGKSKDLKQLLPHLFPHLESMLIEAAAGGAREKLQPTTLSSMKEIIITLSTVDLIR